MQKKIIIFISIFIVLFTVDQSIKNIFVNGFGIDGECISLVLAYNKGVAFSMFAFLEGNLKYIQIAMLIAGIIYLFSNKEIFNSYYIPAAILISGGVSNIYDRFIHEGVVDYVYWHCGFDFAIFNLADVLIDIAVVLMIYINYKNEKMKEKLA
ncbi:MAG: signal peptidase II [Arcobacteraceae bacterium]|jgi:signal peptidase II|nr:signal peptidase II [Arcobacteraceae bacterium]